MSIELRLEVIRLQRTVEQRDQKIAELEAMLQTDPMTGILNRLGFLTQLNSMISSQTRAGGNTYVAFIDVDDFKLLNTNYGHDGGDYALITLATRLKASMRQHDAVGRWSGDEFVIAFQLEDADITNGVDRAIMKRVCEFIEEPIVSKDSRDMKVSCTFGIVKHSGTGQVSPVELIVAADETMLRTKQTCKGEITVVDYVSKSA